MNIDRKFFDPYVYNYQHRILNKPFGRFILFSEGFAFCSFAEQFKVEMIIESGTKWGGSALLFGRYFPDMTIKTIDIKHSPEIDTVLADQDNIKFIKGNGKVEVERLVNQHGHKKLGIFFDGPKGTKAIAIAKKLIEYPNVAFIALHDMYKHELNGTPHNSRVEIDKWDINKFYTDEKWYVGNYGWMEDYQYKHEDKFKKYRSWIDRGYGSHGPTMVIVTKENI